MKIKVEYKNIGRERFNEIKVYNGNKKFIVEMIYEELKHHLISENIEFDEKNLFDLRRSDVFTGFHKVGEIWIR
jgi:hypothetical protein